MNLTLKKTLVAVFASSLTLPFASNAASVDEMKEAQAPLSKQFNVLDKDGDHYLAWSEIKGHDKSLNYGQFLQGDTNGDVRLSADEYATAKAKVGRKKVKQYFDDSTITAEAKAALLAEKSIESMKISVETHKGEVILSGFVDSMHDKKLAAQLVAGINGVSNVVNSLVVKS